MTDPNRAVICLLLLLVVVHSRMVVKTKNGLLRGVLQRVNDRRVTAFLGIPYGKAPIRNRRFSIPETVDNWTGERPAIRMARACSSTLDTTFPGFKGSEQWNSWNQTEDCLNLNLWVPDEHDGSVLIWIYGGGYFSGSPSLDMYDGRMLAVLQRIIVVNINYRLGPFGFLYLGEKSSVPGNMGLLDQQMALRWVSVNIPVFGGDPNRVTLFGESAGASSVSAHLFAPGSRRFFQRIILQSGVMLNTWAGSKQEEIYTRSLSLVSKLNCAAKHVQDAVQCLRRKSVSDIMDAVNEITNNEMAPMTFAFVPSETDVHFFRGNVRDKFERRQFKKDVDVLLGTNNDEGSYWLPYYLPGHLGFTFDHTVDANSVRNQALISPRQFRAAIAQFAPYFNNSSLALHGLQHLYGDRADDQLHRSERLRDGVSAFVGDYFFTCDIMRFADVLSQEVYGSVYVYHFAHRSSANPWPTWMGVMHGYEIEYVFGLPIRRPLRYDPMFVDLEQHFSKDVMKLWVDFANSGHPSALWPQYSVEDKRSFVLNGQLLSESRTKNDIRGPYCALLSEIDSFLRIDCLISKRAADFTVNNVRSLLSALLLIFLNNWKIL